LTDPRSGVYSFDYDAEGRLIRATDPAQGSLDLTFARADSSWSVDQASNLGRTDGLEVQIPSTDGETSTSLSPDQRLFRKATDSAGISMELREGKDESYSAQTADGMRAVTALSADPLLGELAQFADFAKLTTPGGLEQVATTSNTKVPESPESKNAASWT